MNPVKVYKPTSPGRRGMTSVNYRKVLTSRKPHKALVKGVKSRAGRDKRGQITVERRGAGAKQRIRIVDTRRNKLGIPARVESLEYDPKRSAFIALITYLDGEKSYIIAPQGLRVGDKIVSNTNTKIKVGNRLAMKNIPAGVSIYNLEMSPGKGGQLVRAAGTAAVILGFEGKYAQVKMPSGERRLLLSEGMATVGVISNPEHSLVKIGKAGRKRMMGRRPRVRGKAKNVIDHPHGGGEGGSPIGLKHPKTPTGKPALGYRTRRKKLSDQFILRRRPKKRRKK